MASVRRTLRTRVTDNELDSPTKLYPLGERLRHNSIDFTSGIDGSTTPHPHSTQASPVPYAYAQEKDIAPRPYCSPASPLPISIYNFIPSQSGDAVKSSSSTKTVCDMSRLPVAAMAAVQGTSASCPPHASLASRRDGQPLPKPSQPPPKPAPGPKPQNRDQGEDLLHCADCSLATASHVYPDELQLEGQKRRDLPGPMDFDGCDSERDWASSSESDSDSESRCSMVCSCCSCYSAHYNPEGSMTDFSETATLASQDADGESEGGHSQIAVDYEPQCGSGDGRANDDIDDAGSSRSACSEGWVDLAEPSQRHRRLHDQSESEQDLWSPPPPSSPRRW